MIINVEALSKRFNREWILKNLHFSFSNNQIYAIEGPNGSGKSTLLKILSGHLSPSKGKISFSLNEKKIEVAEVYSHLSFAAPYIDLIEEFTLAEAIRFHLHFKSLRANLTGEDLVELTGLQKSRNKQIRYFSSGMKQRLKLVLAICSDTQLLLLDEPTSNFDQQGVEWYRQLVQTHADGRLLVIASNVELDFDFAHHRLNILDYK